MEKIKLPENIKNWLDKYRIVYEEDRRLTNEMVGPGSTLYSEERKSDEELLEEALLSEITGREFRIESKKELLKKIEENLHEAAKETDTTSEGNY